VKTKFPRIRKSFYGLMASSFMLMKQLAVALSTTKMVNTFGCNRINVAAAARNFGHTPALEAIQKIIPFSRQKL
jgi:hypothetical protein